MEGFSLLDEYTEELAVGELVTETGCEIGSAVLIAPRIVITAGHCVDDGDVKYFKSGCTLYGISQYRLHPKYKIGDTVFVDLAVCLLETTCPAVPIRFMNAETNKYTNAEAIMGCFGTTEPCWKHQQNSKCCPSKAQYFLETLEVL
jgi:hypothetical protein